MNMSADDFIAKKNKENEIRNMMDRGMPDDDIIIDLDELGLDLEEEDKKDKEVKQKGYYIRPEQIKRMAFERAETGKTLSQIVQEAIDIYFIVKENKETLQDSDFKNRIDCVLKISEEK